MIKRKNIRNKKSSIRSQSRKGNLSIKLKRLPHNLETSILCIKVLAAGAAFHLFLFNQFYDLVVDVFFGVDAPGVVEMGVVFYRVDLEVVGVEVTGEDGKVGVGDHGVLLPSEYVALKGELFHVAEGVFGWGLGAV